MAGPILLPVVKVDTGTVNPLTAALMEERALMCITDISAGPPSLFVQFNPTEFSESLSVNYSKHIVPGLSHEVMQYVNTANDAFELELFFTADTQDQIARNLIARRQIQSYHYPRRSGGGIVNAGPPRLLFVWPQFISLTCVITSANFTYQQFTPGGQPIRFTAAITLEEIREIRLLADDILAFGSNRADMYED